MQASRSESLAPPVRSGSARSKRRQLLTGRRDDETAAAPRDVLACAQLKARLAKEPEHSGSVANFVKRQLVPIAVDDGNFPEMTRHWSAPLRTIRRLQLNGSYIFVQRESRCARGERAILPYNFRYAMRPLARFWMIRRVGRAS